MHRWWRTASSPRACTCWAARRRPTRPRSTCRPTLGRACRRRRPRWWRRRRPGRAWRSCAPGWTDSTASPRPPPAATAGGCSVRAGQAAGALTRVVAWGAAARRPLCCRLNLPCTPTHTLLLQRTRATGSAAGGRAAGGGGAHPGPAGAEHRGAAQVGVGGGWGDGGCRWVRLLAPRFGRQGAGSAVRSSSPAMLPMQRGARPQRRVTSLLHA